MTVTPATTAVTRHPGRWLVFALIALGAAQAALWIRGLPPGAGAPGFPARAIALVALQLCGAALAWRRRDRVAIAVVLAFAVVFRLAAWTWPPDLSSDLYRYVWDGRVQCAGYSPYTAPPAAPERAALRDDAIWPRINRPDAVTVYPPAAEAAYLALAAAGGDSIRGVKSAALAAELAALALLLYAGRRRWRAGPLALYAWSPLVISEVCVSGHVDALVLPLVVGALALVEARRCGWAGAVLGVATAVKLYPIVLLAAVPRGGRRVAVAAAAAAIACCYAPYAAGAGLGVLGFLPEYVRVGEDFNVALRGFVEAGLAPLLPHARGVAIAVCAAGFAAVCAAVARRSAPDPWRSARTLATAFVLLLPTAVHPWYAMWLVPLVAARPSAAGVWLASAVPLSYLKYGTASGDMPAWVQPVEFLPAAALIVAAWAWRRRAAREMA